MSEEEERRIFTADPPYRYCMHVKDNLKLVKSTIAGILPDMPLELCGLIAEYKQELQDTAWTLNHFQTMLSNEYNSIRSLIQKLKANNQKINPVVYRFYNKIEVMCLCPWSDYTLDEYSKIYEPALNIAIRLSMAYKVFEEGSYFTCAEILLHTYHKTQTKWYSQFL